MTNQEAFDTAYVKIMEQGEQSATFSGSCRYRKGETHKCAIGHLIPDDLYSFEFEGNAIRVLLVENEKLKNFFEACGTEFLRDLQIAHDVIADIGEDYLVEFRKMMKTVASAWDLNTEVMAK